MMGRLLYAGAFALYLLHTDLWLWSDSRTVLGLPVGLAYHLGFCAAASLLFAGLVTQAWPRLDSGDSSDAEDSAQ